MLIKGYFCALQYWYLSISIFHFHFKDFMEFLQVPCDRDQIPSFTNVFMIFLLFGKSIFTLMTLSHYLNLGAKLT